MLILDVISPERRREKLYFNPYTMKFSLDKNEVEDVPFDNTVSQKIHTNKPHVLKIMLGDACNFRCKYCRQDHHSHKELFSKSRIDNFLQMLTDNTDLSQLRRIEYWGGEPLLYWDEIEYLIERSKSFPTEHINHHITTNGSLLNAKMVNTIKSNPFLFKLSHDGPGQCLRTADPLISKEKEILEIYEWLTENPNKGTFYINSVLTKLCISPGEIVDWFRTRLGDDILIMKIEPVIPYNSDAQKYAIGDEDLPRFTMQIFRDILQKDIVKNVIEYQMLWDSFQYMTNEKRYVYNMTEAKCHISQLENICTDLNGNITPCQVYDQYTPEQIIGNLTKVNQVNDLIPYAPINRAGKCVNCPVISLCRGVCPHIAPGEAADLNCKMRYHTYIGILAAFIFFKTKLYLDPTDRRSIHVCN